MSLLYLELQSTCQKQNCQYRCALSRNSTQCYCRDGYELGADRKSCIGRRIGCVQDYHLAHSSVSGIHSPLGTHMNHIASQRCLSLSCPRLGIARVPYSKNQLDHFHRFHASAAIYDDCNNYPKKEKRKTKEKICRSLL